MKPTQLRKANDQMIKELDAYHKREAQMQAKEAALENVNYENDELKARLAILKNWEQEKIRFQQELDKKKRDAEQYKLEEEKRLAQRDDEIEKLKKQVQESQQMQSEISTKIREKAMMEANLAELRNQEAVLLNKIAMGQQLSEQEQAELERLRKLIKQKEDEIEELKRQLNKIQKQFSQTELEKQKRQGEKELLFQKQQDLQDLKKKLENIEKQKQQLQSSQTALEKKSTEINDELKRILEANNKLKEENDKLAKIPGPVTIKKIENQEEHDTKIKVRTLSLICLFFILISFGMQLFAAASPNWDQGQLYKPMNYQPEVVDTFLYSNWDYTHRIQQPLGHYQRGIFMQCEQYTDFNSNGFEHKVQVQQRRSYQPINLSQAAQSQEKLRENMPLGDWWNQYSIIRNNFNIFSYNTFQNFQTVSHQPIDEMTMETWSLHQEFDIKDFEGCKDFEDTRGLKYLQFCCISTIVSIFVLIFLFGLGIYDHKGIFVFYKMINLLLTYILAFGIQVTAVYGQYKGNLYQNDNQMSIYSINNNEILLNDFQGYGQIQNIYTSSLGNSFVLYTIGWILTIPIFFIVQAIKKAEHIQ